MKEKIKADRAMVTVEFWRKSHKLEQGEEMMEEISNRIYGIIPDLELSREISRWSLRMSQQSL